MTILRTASVLAAIATLSGCELVGGSDPKSNATPQEQTDVTGQAAVQLFANQDQAGDSTASALENAGMDGIGSRMSPAARQNLLSANATFKNDLLANPDDPKAAFGVAVTSLSLKVDDLSDSLKRMWDAGLRVGDEENPGGIFKSSPTALVSGSSFAARALSDPRNAPKISQLQGMLDTKLMPTVDSAVTFLTRCWNNPDFKYRFQVTVNGKVDSLTIGRADIGFALAGLRTARAYFTWLLAQNVDADFDGSYAWIDTLSHIDEEVGPTTAAQDKAFGNIKTLLAPGSSFLTIRAGYESRIAALPAELISIAKLAKEAGDQSVLRQITRKDGLIRLSNEDNAEFQRYADSATLYLSGMHTYQREARTEHRWAGTVCSFPVGQSIQNCTDTYEDVAYPGFSIRMDVSKLITLSDKKIFLPKFSWNTTANWATKGPFSLVKGAKSTPMLDFDQKIVVDSAKDMDPYMEWADPTFGGAFEFTSTLDVLKQFDAMDEKPVRTTGLSPAPIPL